MRLDRFLEDSAARSPDQAALVCQGRRWTYRELETSAARLAAGFLEAGLRRGDRVGIWLDDRAESVIAIFAALKAGAVFSVHPAAARPATLRERLLDSGARVLVTDPRRLETLREDLPALSGLESVVVAGSGPFSSPAAGPRVLTWETALSNEAPKTWPRTLDLDLAGILYTSGSTGRPKGVMLTHHNMTSASAAVVAYLENTAEDVILNLLPLSFSYGLYQVLTAFQVGATVLLEGPLVYPYPVIERLVRERATGFPLVPAIASLLMRLQDLAQYDLSSVRYVTTAAQASTPRQLLTLQEIFPQAKVYSMYGQTECMRVSYLPPEELARRPTSVGKAIPNTETYLVDAEERPVNEPGVIGELVVRGPHVMQGYWNRPEETARRLRPGRLPWERHLHTGDLFKQDAEGFLYFVARQDDLIKTGGELVSPKEVEDALGELPGIAEAAVKGGPDEVLGQTLTAFVVLQPGSSLTEADVIGFCRRRLEAFKVPRSVRVLTELPRTETGKVRKLDL